MVFYNMQSHLASSYNKNCILIDGYDANFISARCFKTYNVLKHKFVSAHFIL